MFKTKYRVVKVDDMYYVQYKSLYSFYRWVFDEYVGRDGCGRLCPFKTQELAEEQIARWMPDERLPNIEIVKEYFNG
jgi:hypothetical protein